jgi:hypothetical protein
MFKSGDCAGRGRCRNVSPYSATQDRTLLAVYGRNVILKNCNIFRKQPPGHRMHLITYNVHVITGSNSTNQRNYRTNRIPRYCWFHVSQLEPGIQFYRFSWAFFEQKPGLMWETTLRTIHVTVLCISSHQTSLFYDHHTIFFAFYRCF